MAVVKGNRLSHPARGVAPAHEWEMVSGFLLKLAPKGEPRQAELLAPLAEALASYGLEEGLLRVISSEVETLGEELRDCCPEGRLDCVQVRVHLSTAALSNRSAGSRRWDYFVVKNIASSESDNLNMLEDPRCFIDVHVF